MNRPDEVPIQVVIIAGGVGSWFSILSAPVTVRFRAGRALPWRCRQCGKHREPTCEHEILADNAWQKRKQPTEGNQQ